MSRAPRIVTSPRQPRASSAQSARRDPSSASGSFQEKSEGRKEGRKEGAGTPLSDTDSHEVLATLLADSPDLFAAWTVPLTPKEAIVLRHFLIDQCDKLVARRLGTSPNTVRNQMTGILQKLKFTSRFELLVAATTALLHK